MAQIVLWGASLGIFDVDEIERKLGQQSIELYLKKEPVDNVKQYIKQKQLNISVIVSDNPKKTAYEKYGKKHVQALEKIADRSAFRDPC